MRLHLPARFVLVLSALLVGGLAVGADWSRFRGPNGTGTSSDKNIPVQFSATDGVLWKVELPGVGNGSPIVAGGKLYLQSATADGKERILVCLDAASGKPKWTTKVPGARARTHAKNTLASSTPATDGSRVYSAFWDGKDVTLYAHDAADGKQIWKKPLGSHQSQHGVGHSPMVHNGKVYFMHDQDGDAFLVCLSATDGEELWRKPRKAFRACYSTPWLFDGNGKTELIVTSTA